MMLYVGISQRESGTIFSILVYHQIRYVKKMIYPHMAGQNFLAKIFLTFRPSSLILCRHKKADFYQFEDHIMKKALTFCLLYLSLCLVCTGYAAERDITLQWDESIDAPYLQSYVVYYYTAQGAAGSLNASDYAVSYKLPGGSPILINPSIDPKPITINKSNTQITLHFSTNVKDYYFVVTAVDTRGLESIPSPEVSTIQYHVSVEPVAISFDPVVIGGSSPAKTITIRNSGAANLYISAITLNSADASKFAIRNDNCSGKTIAASKSCTVEALFLPMEAGVKTATVAIASSAYNSVSVSLRGDSPGKAAVSSSNATISEQTVTDSVSGAPDNYTPQTVATFRATGVANAANFSITYASLPENPVFYRVVSGVWVQIYPSNQSNGGITNVGLNGNILSFTVTDNAVSDGDPTVGIIYATIVVGTLANRSESGGGGGGGGCFIATAAFGSYFDPHVKVLREFRDRWLLTNPVGKAFVSYYYQYSPPVADIIRKHESFKSAARWALIPIVYGVEYPYIMAVLLIIPAGAGLAYRRYGRRKSAPCPQGAL
jgi:hypothetical protein